MNNDYETPFSAEEIDEQIDLYTQMLRAIPAEEAPAPDLRLIDDLGQFYPADEAAARSLARVRQRLLSSAPSVNQGEWQAGLSGRLNPLKERREHTHLSQSLFDAGQRAPYRIATIAAAVLLVVVLGGLVAGLVLVRYGNATGHQPHPQGPIATTPPAASNVYVAASVGLYKIDAQTGKIRWHVPMTASKVTLVGDVVYVIEQSGAIAALNASDGSTRWTITTIGGKSGAATQLSIANGVLYIGSQADALLYAFNAGTGKELWHSSVVPEDQLAGEAYYEGVRAVNGVVYGSYILLASLIASSGPPNAWLFAASAQDGSVLWRVAAPPEQLFNGPVVANGMVYITSSVNSTKDVPRPSEGYAYAYDLNGKLLWQSQKTTGLVLAQPTPGDGGVYFGAQRDALYDVKMTDGSPLWKYATGTGSVTAPVQVVGNVVYVGENGTTQFDDFMLALNATTGELLWKQAITAYYGSRFAASDQAVYVTSDEGILYALSAQDGSQLWSVQYAPNSHVGVNSGMVILGP